jgi:hypothetical protein
LGHGPYEALVTPHPEWTEFHPAVPHCGKGCLWPWQTAYFVVFFTFQPQPATLPARLITVPIDTSGQPIAGFPSAGAPPCAAHPSQCSFPISRDSARAIALSTGLPLGIEPWSLTFLWLSSPRVGDCTRCAQQFESFGASEWPTYGWEVVTVLRRSPATAAGETLYIDATSGRVLDRRQWSLVQ